MGKRQRKAAREGHVRAGGNGRRPEDIENLIWRAVGACQRRRPEAQEWVAAVAARGAAAVAAATPLLHRASSALADRGWSETDVRHVVSRRLSPEHADVVATCRPTGHSAADALGQIVECLALVTALPDIAVPAPDLPAAASSGLDSRLLQRVRGLLRKAESTEFAEEAEALTAKAQELIARHAIDTLELDGDGDHSQTPVNRRIYLDDPYVDAKALLVDRVAAANRCRAVYASVFGWSDVVGFPADLDAVELLTQSLLAQAASAVAREGSRVDGAGRSRTRSFRRAFLVGFAQRIGERLAAATTATVAASGDDRLLPVLQSRDARVRDHTAELFPRVEQRSTSISNGSGWAAGKAAADVADLSVGRGVSGSV
jgi:hypothetical protein